MDETYTAIPPVRRNGPQESIKEHLEAVEYEHMLAALGRVVDSAEGTAANAGTAMNESLTSSIESLSTSVCIENKTKSI